MKVRNKIFSTFVGLNVLVFGLVANTSYAADKISKDEAKKLVETTCAACHVTGALKAPRLGNVEEWRPRLKQSESQLIAHAIKGFNQMPARGGNPALTNQQITAAVRYMTGLISEKLAAAATSQSSTPAPAAATPEKSVAMKPEPKAVVVAKKPAAKKVVARKKVKRVNTFNRLLKPASKRNPPPAKDGIHDPDNDGTHVLLAPKESFSVMEKSNSGNRVDWVKSLNNGSIEPRFDKDDPTKQPMVLDLNIVREVKGSMPNVVYPHKQHTEWLDCSNCHPAIFIPKKGANEISMASILLGEKCGVCHGKVAFPIAECRKCHSQRKPKKKK